MLFSKSCSEMRPKVDKLNHYPLFIKRKANQQLGQQPSSKTEIQGGQLYQASVGWDQSHPANPSLEQL
jgi:hypothetical protein